MRCNECDGCLMADLLGISAFELENNPVYKNDPRLHCGKLIPVENILKEKVSLNTLTKFYNILHYGHMPTIKKILEEKDPISSCECSSPPNFVVCLECSQNMGECDHTKRKILPKKLPAIHAKKSLYKPAASILGVTAPAPPVPFDLLMKND